MGGERLERVDVQGIENFEIQWDVNTFMFNLFARFSKIFREKSWLMTALALVFIDNKEEVSSSDKLKDVLKLLNLFEIKAKDRLKFTEIDSISQELVEIMSIFRILLLTGNILLKKEFLEKISDFKLIVQLSISNYITMLSHITEILSKNSEANPGEIQLITNMYDWLLEELKNFAMWYTNVKGSNLDIFGRYKKNYEGLTEKYGKCDIKERINEIYGYKPLENPEFEIRPYWLIIYMDSMDFNRFSKISILWRYVMESNSNIFLDKIWERNPETVIVVNKKYKSESLIKKMLESEIWYEMAMLLGWDFEIFNSKKSFNTEIRQSFLDKDGFLKTNSFITYFYNEANLVLEFVKNKILDDIINYDWDFEVVKKKYIWKESWDLFLLNLLTLFDSMIKFANSNTVLDKKKKKYVFSEMRWILTSYLRVVKNIIELVRINRNRIDLDELRKIAVVECNNLWRNFFTEIDFKIVRWKLEGIEWSVWWCLYRDLT